MNIKINKFLFLFFLALSSLLISCDDDAADNQLPYIYVDIIINTNNLQYDDLRTRGFTYLEGGYRGIILYKPPFGRYRAFERACTFQPENPCGIVEVHVSGFYMEDPCCSSTFDFEGFPTGGPARVRLREYFILEDGPILRIGSEPF